jgi:predicted regulator of Ras-like GTPase activity (Roadblock/LC7/MglB family)
MPAGCQPLTSATHIVLYEAEYQRIKAILALTQRDLRADLVLLIDRSGQQIASEGPAKGIDLTALASLAAANIAATDGLARLVGEPEFSILSHQGRRRSIQISDVAKKYSLVVVFDDSVSLGMVRLRVKRATAYLEEILRSLLRKAESAASTSKPAPKEDQALYFTDEDIDKLFSFLTPGS